MLRLTLAATVAFALTSTHAAERPNIILAMGDDHGWEETGYNGHPLLRTPVLDEMAANGLRMDRFYAAHPSCSPTRGSVMTGRHPVRYGTFAPNWSIRPEEITIAQLLSQAGYACGHFGKWHLGPVKADSPTSPGAMGFEHWLSHDNFFELNPQLSRNGGAPQLFEGESSEVITREAIRFIRQANAQSKPFFVVLWFGSPHEPYSGLPPDLQLYDDLPEQLSERKVKLTSNETGSAVERPLREVLRERYAEITAMDRALGTLREALQADQLKNSTLLWYCGDNGTPSSGLAYSPLRGQKGQMYEGGIRVPGLIEWPQRITAGRVSQINAVTSDMLPTVCELAGVDLPNRALDGISLIPLIDGKLESRSSPICFWSFANGGASNGKPQPWIEPELQQGTTPLVKLMAGKPTRTFRNFHHPQIQASDFAGERAIIGDQYKLVIRGKGNEVQQLFDLRSDPAEKNDLSDSEVEIAIQLRDQLREWQQSVLESLTGAEYHAATK